MAVDVRPGRVSAGVRRSARARYLPIAEHGLIGDLHTVALDRAEPGERSVLYSDADVAAEFDATVAGGGGRPRRSRRERHT
jgi:hypothetical protein